MIRALTRTALLSAALIALSALAGIGLSARAGEGDFCNKASQCHGFLPHICERCSGGHSACAHWACVHHRCEIQTCPR